MRIIVLVVAIAPIIINCIDDIPFYRVIKRQKRATAGTPVTISSADSTSFLSSVNSFRGNAIPIPTKMNCLTYSSSLATAAQTKATSCDISTQSTTQAISFDATQQTLPNVLSVWGNEIYDPFSDLCLEIVDVNCYNYKAVYYETSTSVGCAMAFCTAQAGLPSAGWLTVCEFSNAFPATGTPYTTGGAECSACLASVPCVDGLCCATTATTTTSTTSSTKASTSTSTSTTTTKPTTTSTSTSTTTTTPTTTSTSTTTTKPTTTSTSTSTTTTTPTTTSTSTTTTKPTTTSTSTSSTTSTKPTTTSTSTSTTTTKPTTTSTSTSTTTTKPTTTSTSTTSTTSTKPTTTSTSTSTTTTKPTTTSTSTSTTTSTKPSTSTSTSSSTSTTTTTKPTTTTTTTTSTKPTTTSTTTTSTKPTTTSTIPTTSTTTTTTSTKPTTTTTTTTSTKPTTATTTTTTAKPSTTTTTSSSTSTTTSTKPSTTTTTSSTTSTTSTRPTTTAACIDNAAYPCSTTDYCNLKPALALVYCKKTCNNCGATCTCYDSPIPTGIGGNCNGLPKAFCVNTATWQKCPVQCDKCSSIMAPGCPPCADTMANCTTKLCDATPGLFKPRCQQTCNNCDGCNCVDSKTEKCYLYPYDGRCALASSYWYCPVTCNKCSKVMKTGCTEKCQDLNPSTDASMQCSLANCQSAPGQYLPLCHKTCNNCNKCVCLDSTTYDCLTLKSTGGCLNPGTADAARIYCPVTCNKCSQVQAYGCPPISG